MAYTIAYQDLGATGLVDVATAVAKVVEDPCLPRVANLVLELHAEEAKKTAPRRPRRPSKPSRPSKPPMPAKGIGLCEAVKPLEWAVKVKKRPWLAVVAGGAVVGGLVLVGYGLGRMR